MTSNIIPVGPMTVLGRFANSGSLASSVPTDVLSALATALDDPNLNNKRRLFIARMPGTYGLTGRVDVYIRTIGNNTVFGVDTADATMPTDFIKPAVTIGGEVIMPEEVFVFEVHANTIDHMSWTYGDTDAAMAELFKDAGDVGC
jgi:hypothetical protein